MQKEIKVLGIDPSATATGLVVLRSNANGPEVLYEAETSFPDMKGLERCSAIAEVMLHAFDFTKPDFVVIEGYGFANKHSLVTLVEVGTVLRYFMRQCQYTYYEPAPNQLKKFVIGKGKGAKSQMMMNVLKRWGHESQTENTADAYGLACMGLGVSGNLKGMTQPMLEVIGVMKPVK